ncbi:MAG: hypothetical protein FWE03_01415 [Firmicutes bacterium]|nr:hypothetical protein [Bacillota bacterium]
MKKNSMKIKLLLTLALSLIMLLFNINFYIASTKANTTSNDTYSRYGLLRENAILLDSNFEKITTLPPTYFVIIINETDFENYYRVTYLELTGIILRTHITRVNFEPVTKFHENVFFTAQNDTHPVNIRALPNSTAEIITAIPHNNQAFFFGQKNGEALITTHGSRWYFVRFLDGTVNRFGYVYSAQGIVDTIPPNIIQAVPNPPDNNNNLDPNTPPQRFDWIYIVLLSIPAIIVMFALFSKPKKDTDIDKEYADNYK